MVATLVDRCRLRAGRVTTASDAEATLAAVHSGHCRAPKQTLRPQSQALTLPTQGPSPILLFNAASAIKASRNCFSIRDPSTAATCGIILPMGRG
jgi:hypothetical protein